MKLIRSCIVAFSMYSKIPTPQLEWKEDDMRYMLCFFPWIGAVIGVLIWLWHWLCDRLGIGMICYIAVGMLIPIAVTGGFHIDGFMDTMDAFHSYQPRERKLEILKDPHIGAFAVIMLAAYGLLYLGAFSQITDPRCLAVFCSGFFLARGLSGMAVVSWKSAKTDGLLYMFADAAQKRIVKGALLIQLILCTAWMLYLSLPAGTTAVVAALGSFLYYYYKSKKELGGITGDTAGCFVTVCEGCMAVVTAVVSIVISSGR